MSRLNDALYALDGEWDITTYGADPALHHEVAFKEKCLMDAYVIEQDDGCYILARFVYGDVVIEEARETVDEFSWREHLTIAMEKLTEEISELANFCQQQHQKRYGKPR